jgi:MFS transporter, YNFM family, putative membrane transport protein
MRANRRLGAVLWCAGLAAFAAMYAPQGLLTEIARDAAVDPSRASLVVSAATLGLGVSVLPWAWLSDRIGIRSAMRLAAAGAAICAVTVPWLPTYAGLVGGRFLQGIALGGIPALAMALLHDTTTAKHAATMAGSYVAATSLGGLGGRLLVVPVADQVGWRVGLFVIGCLVAALMAGLIGLMPRPAENPAHQADISAGAVLTHLRNPAMVALFGIGALLIGGMIAVFNYLPFRLEQPPYLLTPDLVSLVFLAYLAGTAGSRATGWLTGRVGQGPVLAAACVMMAGGGAITLAQPLYIVVAGVVVLTAGLFIGHAVASSMVAARAVTGRAQAAALYNISYYAGSSAFGWLAGFAWQHAHWPLVATVVVVLGASACALTGLVYSSASRKACDGHSFTASRACSSSPSGTSSTSTVTMPSSS